MEEIFPNYYKKFKCIADRCKHSCCIGWEIDIDDDTKEYYESLEGDFAEKLRERIKGEPAHFTLCADGRCPFLNKEGLCDIIIELGEDSLCDICFLHPRFSNVYEDFIETGLGLCCEEAARLILGKKEPSVLMKNGEAEYDEIVDLMSQGLIDFAIIDNRFNKRNFQ